MYVGNDHLNAAAWRLSLRTVIVDQIQVLDLGHTVELEVGSMRQATRFVAGRGCLSEGFRWPYFVLPMDVVDEGHAIAVSEVLPVRM